MLIVVEGKMIKSKSEAEVLKGSDSKVSMDIDNDDICGLEQISLFNGNGLAKVKLFDCMVKRKTSFKIVPCVNPKKSICFYCQLKGHWLRSYPKYLKDL